ncbi:peptidoglycan DD-metalloendopeptidase family protein [Streptomyces sp. NPDC020141]|uniref:M23 family metallopeptidase n=1 Tax=Streptomyces sp. NPDC020141 TaxID=3365065 RepID=UPI0037977C80
MPAKGKHRRPRTSTLTRGFVAAGTGGAAFALPLMGATGAHAAERSAPAAVASAPAVAPAAAQAGRAPAAPVGQKPAEAPAATAYRVVAGDHLSKIADQHRVGGGWQKLYADNRAVVGDDPSLIHPGLELALGKPAEAKGSADQGEQRDRAPREAAAPASGGNGPAAPAAPRQAPAQPEAPAAEAAPTPAPQAEPTAPAPAAEAPATAETPAAASGYTTPLAAGGVSTGYRATGSMWSSGYHTGVDFSAPTGTPVRSVGPGTVVSAGWSGAYGNEVVIRHSDGNHSQYAHLSSLSVSAGQDVSGGTQIGGVGSTGNSTGPHLHFEIRTGAGYGSDIDPVAYLRQHGVSL